jgi:hypothetical protein
VLASGVLILSEVALGSSYERKKAEYMVSRAFSLRVRASMRTDACALVRAAPATDSVPRELAFAAAAFTLLMSHCHLRRAPKEWAS